MQSIAKVLFSFSLKEQADRSEREHAFLQYMDRTRPLDGIDKKIGIVSLNWSTTDETDHNTREDDRRFFSIHRLFELESSSTIWDVEHAVRQSDSKKPFIDPSV